LYDIWSEYFYIIATDYNGYDGNSTFSTRKGEANGIVQYLKEQGITRIKMVYGQSMGAEIAIELDELVNKFIAENPDCVVVNIACGLDTRFYRVDNGRITWYNLDLPETIEVRNQIFEATERVSNIGISVLDSLWGRCAWV
jgi:O-methyltransferase involved in polyketide biosynthesis